MVLSVVMLSLQFPRAIGIACQLTGVFVLVRRDLAGSWTRSFFSCGLRLLAGSFYQAGVVPSLLELKFGAKQPAAVVFYHIYMPPLFLTRSRSPESEKGVYNTFLVVPVSQTELNGFRGRCDLKSKDGFNEMPIIDLKGTNESHLLDTLNDLLHCDLRATGNDGIQTMDESDNFVYVVAP
eukprot:scaffold77418_cov29-Attheya_sp.AAC.2